MEETCNHCYGHQVSVSALHEIQLISQRVECIPIHKTLTRTCQLWQLKLLLHPIVCAANIVEIPNSCLVNTESKKNLSEKPSLTKI